jgi:hypothetical protein
MKLLDTLTQMAGDWLRDLILGMLGHRVEDVLDDLMKGKDGSRRPRKRKDQPPESEEGED